MAFSMVASYNCIFKNTYLNNYLIFGCFSDNYCIFKLSMVTSLMSNYIFKLSMVAPLMNNCIFKLSMAASLMNYCIFKLSMVASLMNYCIFKLSMVTSLMTEHVLCTYLTLFWLY